MTSSTAWRAHCLASSLLLAALVAGCGSSRSGTSAKVVNVTERDFHISAPSTLTSGEVTFRVHNAGPDEHEFIVMRATGAADLPRRGDGLTVNEEALKKSLAGELVPGAPGATRDLSLNLAPGRYVFFCDMTGHFMGGMHHEVVVQ